MVCLQRLDSALQFVDFADLGQRAVGVQHLRGDVRRHLALDRQFHDALGLGSQRHGILQARQLDCLGDWPQAGQRPVRQQLGGARVALHGRFVELGVHRRIHQRPEQRLSGIPRRQRLP